MGTEADQDLAILDNRGRGCIAVQRDAELGLGDIEDKDVVKDFSGFQVNTNGPELVAIYTSRCGCGPELVHTHVCKPMKASAHLYKPMWLWPRRRACF